MVAKTITLAQSPCGKSVHTKMPKYRTICKDKYKFKKLALLPSKHQLLYRTFGIVF